jgi:hypothetical protein
VVGRGNEMPDWAMALLFKPVAVVLVLAGLYLLTIFARLMRPVLRVFWPRFLWRDLLFGEGRYSGPARQPASAGDSSLQDPAVIRGELGKDRPSLSRVRQDL